MMTDRSMSLLEKAETTLPLLGLQSRGKDVLPCSLRFEIFCQLIFLYIITYFVKS